MQVMLKRIALALCLALFAHPLAAVAAADPSAPADEYFGAYHLSVLGMRNSLHDLADYGPEQAERVYAKLIVIDDAVAEWRERFPADPWIPKLGLRMARLFAQIGVRDSAAHERATCAWLIATYPGSSESVLAANLRDGQSDDADPSVPIAAPVAATIASAPVAAAPTVIAPVASAAEIPVTSNSLTADSDAPGLAPDPTPAPAAPAHNATVPIVAGAVVGVAAVLLLMRHHH
jgi:hypothetical protein